jgi:hypothetical protein
MDESSRFTRTGTLTWSGSIPEMRGGDGERLEVLGEPRFARLLPLA